MKGVNWEAVANVATAMALVVGVVVFIWEIRSRHQDREFEVFGQLLDAYDRVVEHRKQNWRKIKQVVAVNPRIKHEISDRTSTLDYLTLRASQNEPLFGIEHSLLEDELRSLALLNELCRLGLADEDKLLITKSLHASDISYYQAWLQQLLALREREQAIRAFTRARYDALAKCVVDDVFEPLAR